MVSEHEREMHRYQTETKPSGVKAPREEAALKAVRRSASTRWCGSDAEEAGGCDAGGAADAGAADAGAADADKCQSKVITRRPLSIP
jgi:hypothetical protein